LAGDCKGGLNYGTEQGIMEEGGMSQKTFDQSQKKELRMKNTMPDSVMSEIFPKKMKRYILRGEVYDQLKKMILSGKFKKGQRLVEEELAHRFNASRSPVRTSLLRLRKEKLVIWKHRKGTFVA